MMRSPKIVLLACLVTWACIPAAFAVPVITGTQATEVPRSGRVAFTGTGFGSVEGQVIIAGAPAWITTWTDTRVVAYVPEESPLGPTAASVIAGGQSSNAVPLTVVTRRPKGRVRWTFEIDKDFFDYRPAEAPDGTLYIHSNTDHDGVVYALTPDGGLKWIAKVPWYPYAPPSAGPDNACYVGTITKYYRISPEGQVEWSLQGLDIAANAKVGPDGRLYGVFEGSPSGFAADVTAGTFDWRNDVRTTAWGVAYASEMVFSRAGTGQPIDRFCVDWGPIWMFSLDGDLLWESGTASNVAHTPAVGSDGTIYSPGYLENYMVAYDPRDGSIKWQVDSPWRASVSDAEISADDLLYFRSDGKWIECLDGTDGSSVWRVHVDTPLFTPALAPDDSQVVVFGGGSQGYLGIVRGYDAASGQLLWNVDLQPEWDPEFRIYGWGKPRISANSRTAYIPTNTAQWPTSDGDPRCSLYALDMTDGGLTSELCKQGTVNSGHGAITDTLFVNGSTGDAGRKLQVLAGTSIVAEMELPPAGSNGKFFVHANLGFPGESTTRVLPAGVGDACFPMLLPEAGPVAVWNNIGKEARIGASAYFGQPILDPGLAPTTFWNLPTGDYGNLPSGTELTLQGVILDRGTSSSRRASTTNAVLLQLL